MAVRDASYPSGVNYTKQGGAVRVDDGGVLGRVISTGVNRTMTPEESGALVICTAADLVISLPATEAGLKYTIVSKVASAGTGVSVSPVAADKIMGAGVTAADNKDLINSGASDVVGDSVTVEGDGVDGYFVREVVGTWAREA
jgi:hypothetical protein